MVSALQEHFDDGRVQRTLPGLASEDYGVLGKACLGRAVGVLVCRRHRPGHLRREGKLSELPTNHSPQFAPALDPTLRTGVETLVTAAGAWLSSS